MPSTRKICYFTGTRADFGLMQSTLLQIRDCADLDLFVVATGMHLSKAHGYTVRDISAAGIDIAARVDIDHGEPTGSLMARNVGRMLIGFVEALEATGPDIALVLGDRGEMLAAALAAIHLNIPVAHIHGGERSGTVDEPIRHAISKLAHLHLVSTEESRNRLVRMGERPDSVVVTGAPGLDGLTGLATIGRADLVQRYRLRNDRPLALMLFHPVLQEAGSAGGDTETILEALAAAGFQTLALMPNSDAGSEGVRSVLQKRADERRITLATHLPRIEFVSLMAACDVMIGNSSSGIIEAASFGVPVINVGSRQNMRQRNLNVTDVAADRHALAAALEAVRNVGRYPAVNVYGDGSAGARIVGALRDTVLGPALMAKVNAY